MSGSAFRRALHVKVEVVLRLTVAAEPRADPIRLIVRSVEVICFKSGRSGTADCFSCPVGSRVIAPGLLELLLHVLVVLGIFVLARGSFNRLKDGRALGACPRAGLAEFARFCRFWRWSS